MWLGMTDGDLEGRWAWSDKYVDIKIFCCFYSKCPVMTKAFFLRFYRKTIT